MVRIECDDFFFFFYHRRNKYRNLYVFSIYCINQFAIAILKIHFNSSWNLLYNKILTYLRLWKSWYQVNIKPNSSIRLLFLSQQIIQYNWNNKHLNPLLISIRKSQFPTSEHWRNMLQKICYQRIPSPFNSTFPCLVVMVIINWNSRLEIVCLANIKCQYEGKI